MAMSIRKTMMLSLSTLSILAVIPALHAPFMGNSLFTASQAEAKEGSEGSSGHDGGSEKSDHSSNSDSGSHAGEAAESRHGSDDASGDDKADDTAEDAGKRDQGTEDHGGHGGVEVSISAEGLSGLASGQLRAIDQLGRSLEVEIESQHGNQVAKAHLANRAEESRGAITGVRLVSNP